MILRKYHPRWVLGTLLLSLGLSFWAFETFVLGYMRYINHYGMSVTLGLNSIIILILAYTFYCFFQFLHDAANQ